jgi:hypothetical protein
MLCHSTFDDDRAAALLVALGLAPRRKHWVTLIEADPDIAAVLAAVPIESAVPLTEIGHANEPRTEHEHDGAWFC